MPSCSILTLPGWQNSGPQHWQSRWEALYGYQRVEQHDWRRPLRGDWTARLQEVVVDSPAPVVLDDAPLILVETRKDLADLRLPFETHNTAS